MTISFLTRYKSTTFFSYKQEQSAIYVIFLYILTLYPKSCELFIPKVVKYSSRKLWNIHPESCEIFIPKVVANITLNSSEPMMR